MSFVHHEIEECRKCGARAGAGAMLKHVDEICSICGGCNPGDVRGCCTCDESTNLARGTAQCEPRGKLEPWGGMSQPSRVVFTPESLRDSNEKPERKPGE